MFCRDFFRQMTLSLMHMVGVRGFDPEGRSHPKRAPTKLSYHPELMSKHCKIEAPYCLMHRNFTNAGLLLSLKTILFFLLLFLLLFIPRLSLNIGFPMEARRSAGMLSPLPPVRIPVYSSCTSEVLFCEILYCILILFICPFLHAQRRLFFHKY